MTTTSAEHRTRVLSPAARLLLLTAACGLALVALWPLPVTHDWEFCFYAAGRDALAGRNLYGTLGGLKNPPWLLLLLAPLSLLPAYTFQTLA